ncbi:MAG TPA: LysR family transcriptional regulator [Polyangiales bacterium]|nr:LysR family transcriptional regulator [Polyangiales bacterium]
MRYTLRQLEVFLSVAKQDSVTRAARELALSQSAVSEALAELEGQFGIQLFERVGKRLQLSELGRALRPAAESLHAQALELEGQLASQARVGTVRIGATLSIGDYLVPPLMARFMTDHGRATLHVANTAEIARKVLNFELDIGIVEGEVVEPQLEVVRWRADELVVFCAPTHPFAKKKRLSDADLRSARWIVREPGSGTRQAFERALHGLLPELEIALELQHTEAIMNAVKAGLGVGCISRIALADSLAHHTLVACRVPQRNFQRSFYFLLHKQKYQSAGVRAWLELCKRA